VGTSGKELYVTARTGPFDPPSEEVKTFPEVVLDSSWARSSSWAGTVVPFAHSWTRSARVVPFAPPVDRDRSPAGQEVEWPMAAEAEA